MARRRSDAARMRQAAFAASGPGNCEMSIEHYAKEFDVDHAELVKAVAIENTQQTEVARQRDKPELIAQAIFEYLTTQASGLDTYHSDDSDLTVGFDGRIDCRALAEAIAEKVTK